MGISITLALVLSDPASAQVFRVALHTFLASTPPSIPTTVALLALAFDHAERAARRDFGQRNREWLASQAR